MSEECLDDLHKYCRERIERCREEVVHLDPSSYMCGMYDGEIIALNEIMNIMNTYYESEER